MFIVLSCPLPLCPFVFDWKEYYPEAELEVSLLEEPIVFGLGKNCSLASIFNRIGLRKRSYPFDWNVTTFKILCNLIENDFEDFLNPSNLLWSNQKTFIEELRYGVEFYRDFFEIKKQENPSEKWMITDDVSDRQIYENVLKRYLRRVARFYAVLNSGKPIVLFRFDNPDSISKEQALHLYDLLKMKAPHSNFHLIFIQVMPGEVFLEEDWGLGACIRCFNVGRDGKYNPALTGYHSDWDLVLKELTLK